MRVLFLDRDGVVNGDDPEKYCNHVSEFEFIDGVKNIIRILTKEDWRIFIATNQGGIDAGFLLEYDLLKIHEHMETEIAEAGGKIEKSYYASSNDKEDPDRKPNPGMIFKAKAEFNLDLSNAFMIGDYITDIKAGWNAGITSLLVRTGRGKLAEEMLKTRGWDKRVPIFNDLYDAGIWLRNTIKILEG